MHDMLDCAQKNNLKKKGKSKRKSKKKQNAFKMIASMFPRRCGSYRK